LFNLKKLAEQAIAQVNPLDHGKTAATVARNRPAPPPAQLPSANRQPGPSIVNRLGRDITHNPLTNVVGKNLVKPIVSSAINTGEKSLNTLGAASAGVSGGINAAFQSAVGTDQSYQRALDQTQAAVNNMLSHGLGNKGAYLTPQQASSSGDGLAGLKQNFLEPVAQGVTDIAPFAVPAGAIGQGGKLLYKAGIQGALNAGISSATNAAQQLLDTGHVDFGQNLKAAGLGGAVGAAFPIAGAGAKVAHEGVTTKLVPQVNTAMAARTEAGAVGKNVNEPAPAVSQDSRVLIKAPATKPIPELPSFNAKKYINQQSKAQKIARDKNNPSGLKTKYQATKLDIKSKLVDSFAPIEDTLNKAEKAGAKIDPSHNIKYQIDRALRAKTIAGQHLKDNNLHKIIQKVDNTNEFDQYLIARHAPDVEMNGFKTGRDSAKDAALVKQLNPKYEKHAKALDKYSQGLLDKSVEYGLINKDLAKQLKQQYPNYVPINRIFSDLEQQGHKGAGGNPASLSKQTVVQKLKGSEREIESPLASIVAKTEHVIDQGERNKAASILASYKDLPDNPFGLKELKSAETAGERPVISFLENGKQRRFETTSEIAAAAKSLNKQQLGFVGQVFAVPTRVLRLGATGVNVGFTLANASKDLASGFVNSKHGASMANPATFVKALKAATMHNSKEYGELVREGAGGTSFDIARNEPVQNVKSIRAGRSKTAKATYTVTHPGDLLRAIENTIGRGEEFGRALQYYGNKKAFSKKHNESDARILAADAARNNTINFNRAGDYGRAANTLLPYLNAGVQGARTLSRNIKDRPVQTSTKIAITAFVPMAALTSWNLNDPKRKAAYDDLSDYEKKGNFILVPPNPKKDDATNRWNVIKIPMSQEIANLSDSVRNGVEKLHGDKNFDFAKLTHNLLGTATSLQTSGAREAIGQATPQALKPGLETVMNQNLFTGNPVVPKSLKNLDSKDQYNKYTSGTAKVVGKATNASPLAVDNAIRTSTGGAGQNLVNLSDTALSKLGLIKPEDIKGTSLSKSISNRFSGAQAKSASDKIAVNTSKLMTELKATEGYKALSNDEKAKALNRLENTSKTAQIEPDKSKLSKREAGLLDGSTKPSDFLQPVSSSSAKKSKAKSETTT
jgi:hypothetical protein